MFLCDYSVLKQLPMFATCLKKIFCQEAPNYFGDMETSPMPGDQFLQGIVRETIQYKALSLNDRGWTCPNIQLSKGKFHQKPKWKTSKDSLGRPDACTSLIRCSTPEASSRFYWQGQQRAAAATNNYIYLGFNPQIIFTKNCSINKRVSQSPISHP